ncbi:MAG: hypothetical protein IPM46_04905 [Flavobacteriales bacterium]|nr:hypothetical protein [Flavobacteriales bacterium]
MRPVLPFLLLIGLSACGSIRKQMESAETYEQEGMHAEAHKRYTAILERRPKEVQAHLGMKRTAQVLLDRIQDRALGAYTMNELANGNQARAEAIGYKAVMDRKGLDLQLSPMLETRRKEAMEHEAERLYEDAVAAFAAERFQETVELTERVQALNRDHQEAGHLNRLARSEPLYREGHNARNLGLWREAYHKFNQVVGIDAAFKDALQQRDACRAEASYTLAYLPLYSQSGQSEFLTGATAKDLGIQLATNVKVAILDTRDPFIILVDRENTERLLAEQRRQMNGSFDEQQVAQAGKLMGARYVLTARISRFDDVLVRQIEVHVQLIDAETGRIHLADVVRVNKQEIGQGAPRAQLIQRAAKRIALRLQDFNAKT